MKNFLVLFAVLCYTALGACAQQDKSKRPSPPANVSVETTSGVTVTINYSRPSVKGRTVGKDIAPIGQVWRTGANETTTFEVSKDVTVDGKALKKGKYGLHSIPGEGTSTIIFSKDWDQWGTKYDEKADVLRVDVPTAENSEFIEQFTITVDKEGLVQLLWGNYKAYFTVK